MLSSVDAQSGARVLQLLYQHPVCDALVRQSYQRSRVPLLPFRILEDILQSIRQLLDGTPDVGTDRYLGELAAQISRNSSHPLVPHRSMSVDEYISMFTGANLRWEAVGNIFAVAGRSLMATPVNDPLFLGHPLPARESLLSQLADATNLCLSICNSVASSNELLVSFQVNDIMLKTQQYGDSSMILSRPFIY